MLCFALVTPLFIESKGDELGFTIHGHQFVLVDTRSANPAHAVWNDDAHEFELIIEKGEYVNIQIGVLECSQNGIASDFHVEVQVRETAVLFLDDEWATVLLKLQEFVVLAQFEVKKSAKCPVGVSTRKCDILLI
jgi:hypothetical protein